MFTDYEQMELAVLRRELRNRHARESFSDFITAMMPEFDWNWHHKIIANRLSQLAHQEKQFLLISVGAQSGKSELVSRKLPSWILGVNPNTRVMLTSYGTNFAMNFNRANQRAIMSPEYRAIFPNTKLNSKRGVAKRTSDYFEIEDHGGFLRTVGVGAGSSGYPADLLIIDDPYPDMKSALSKTYRQTVWDWFTSVGLQRLSKRANVVILHTRWTEDDLIGRLSKPNALKGVGTPEILRFPSLADDNLHPEDPRKPGESLWPSWKGDEEYLLAKKNLIGAYMFDAMEQQKPPKLGRGLINVSRFQRFTTAMLPKFDFIFSSWDLNYEPDEQKNSDYVSGLIIGYKKPNIYVLAEYHERYEFTETIETMRQSQALWNINGLLIEKKANGAAAISTLKRELKGINTYTPNGSKVTRVLACQPEINGGNVWFPAGETWVDDAMIEYAGFPEEDHDDRVDALTQAILWLREADGKLGMQKLLEFYGGKQ
jgi:predicted phage terminase large subunit-like protein